MPKPGFGHPRREVFPAARSRLLPDSVPPVSVLLVVRLCNLKSVISNYRQVSRNMCSLPSASLAARASRHRLLVHAYGREKV
jgi:hypothetical protein